VPKVVWKGAVTFGLVYVPISLYPGSRQNELDLDLIDKRDFAPVGYKRVNKRTGEEVPQEDLVKGYEYEEGKYVVLSNEDIRQANVEATQTVEIRAFVDVAQIPAAFFDTPYHMEPGKGGEKAYALLRETLERTGRVGVATVVIRTRQYLAAVIPVGTALVLNTLRYADEIRSSAELALPEKDPKHLGITPKELAMAARLVEDMTEDWAPETYRDTFRDDLMARIEKKIRSGETHVVTQASEERAEPPSSSAQVIDLMSMLKQSLDKTKRPDRSDRADSPGRSRSAASPAAVEQRAATKTKRAAGGAAPSRKRA